MVEGRYGACRHVYPNELNERLDSRDCVWLAPAQFNSPLRAHKLSSHEFVDRISCGDLLIESFAYGQFGTENWRRISAEEMARMRSAGREQPILVRAKENVDGEVVTWCVEFSFRTAEAALDSLQSY